MDDKVLVLEETFKNIKEDEISVLIHSFPDPDAISSALGIVTYLKILGVKVRGIYYTGEISHPQNRSMLTLLNLTLTNYEEDPFPKGSKIVLIDTTNVGENSNQASVDSSDVDIVAVIDHHKGKHPKGSKVDYRPVGATASIVWDYLRKIGYGYEGDDGKLLATALAVGIITDTDSLFPGVTVDLDFEAYRDVSKKADQQKLSSIMKYPLPPYLFDLRHTAFLEENKRIEDATIVSGIGMISPTKRDALPIIAEELLRMSGITTSIVFAVIDDFIDISVRTKDITVDVASFIQKAFGGGGGKLGSGGAKIPLGYLKRDDDKGFNDKLWDLVKESTFNRVFSEIKGE